MCRQCEITSELQAWGQALLRSYELTADGRSRRQAWAILQEEALESQQSAERKEGRPIPLRTIGRVSAIRLRALGQAYAAKARG